MLWLLYMEQGIQKTNNSDSNNSSTKSGKIIDMVANQVLPPWWEFWKTLPIAWRFLNDKNVPSNGKIAYILVTVAFTAYVMFPLDFMPELLFPVVGYIDDLGTIPAFFYITNQFIIWCNKKITS